MSWTDISLAEWYALEIEKIRDSARQDVTSLYYHYSYDSTFTLPSEFTDTDVRFLYITVIPVTGPDPERVKGNFSSDLVESWVYCYRGYDDILVTVLDTSKRKPDYRPSEPTKRSPADIVQAVYETYKR
ncbi:MAG: hypothetical protein ACOYVF_04780 [Candidatus Zixiibacteriota bacterium]